MRKFLLRLLRGYKRYISPLLPPACRFYPTCSVYAMTAVERFGAGKGLVLAIWRVLRCNPFCRGWIDHVPPKIEGEPFRVTLGKIRRHETQVDYARSDENNADNRESDDAPAAAHPTAAECDREDLL